MTVLSFLMPVGPAAALGLLGRLTLLSFPQELLFPSKGLGLWCECLEFCSTLQWALPWG